MHSVRALKMKIAVLGWGSLIWEPRNLPLKSDWMQGGPELPLEFSRISKDGRLTLVIDMENGERVPSRYAISERKDLGDAIADLRDREGTIRKHIGLLEIFSNTCSRKEFPEHANVFDEMEEWCKANSFDAVIWTALPSQFKLETGESFTVDNAIKYLRSLPTTVRANALKYIKNAPTEVHTPVRKKTEDLQLG